MEERYIGLGTRVINIMIHGFEIAPIITELKEKGFDDIQIHMFLRSNGLTTEQTFDVDRETIGRRIQKAVFYMDEEKAEHYDVDVWLWNKHSFNT